MRVIVMPSFHDSSFLLIFKPSRPSAEHRIYRSHLTLRSLRQQHNTNNCIPILSVFLRIFVMICSQSQILPGQDSVFNLANPQTIFTFVFTTSDMTLPSAMFYAIRIFRPIIAAAWLDSSSQQPPQIQCLDSWVKQRRLIVLSGVEKAETPYLQVRSAH